MGLFFCQIIPIQKTQIVLPTHRAEHVTTTKIIKKIAHRFHRLNGFLQSIVCIYKNRHKSVPICSIRKIYVPILTLNTTILNPITSQQPKI